MKTKQLLGIAAIALLGFTSCESASRLARDIEGTWAGAPAKLMDDFASTASYIPVYTFEKSESENGGQVMITALVSASGSVNGSTAVVSPFSMSASGRATVNGTWHATDDDEIFISLEPTSLQVEVDPEAVVMTFDTMTDTERTVGTDSIKSAMMPVIRAQMTTAMQRQFLEINKIDDIEIHDNIMTCEIGKTDLSFKRQTNP